MTSPEFPIIQIERRKAIALFASVLILSVALFGGLVKIGWGISTRSENGIVVTGSARTDAVADNAVWTLSVSLSRAKVADAVAKVDNDVAAVTKYLTDGGIPAESLSLGPVSTYGQEEYANGNPTGRILNYRATRDVTVRTKDVELVSKLSQGIGTILQSGVSVNNYGPQYYISTLADLRPKLLEEAMKDAKVRALAITKAVDSHVGVVTGVKSGVFQVTTPDSTMTSDVGAYDTTTIKKTVTSTVSVTFTVNND